MWKLYLMVAIRQCCWVQMAQKVKISARIDADLWERVQDYGIDFSRVIRNSLEEAVKNKEIEDLVKTVEQEKYSADGFSPIVERRVRE